MTATATTLRVRPRRSLMSSALLSIVLAMIPVFGVLYWFAFQHGSWGLVFVVHLALTIISIATLARLLTVFTAVTETELIGRGTFSPLVRVPLSSIDSVDMVPTYVGQSPDPVMQFLVRDESGARLFRMRGTYWNPEDLTAVAEALPVAPHYVQEPIAIRDFYRTYPGSAYWFQNRPALWIVVFALAVLLIGAVAAWVMTIFGMPVGFLPS
ncbi:MAG TPA: hypothetical protein VFQ74_05825 [Pseudolysinimonas sp.]|nr:hypothetical protein [Pseudolysinimonas sp.]